MVLDMEELHTRKPAAGLYRFLSLQKVSELFPYRPEENVE